MPKTSIRKVKNKFVSKKSTKHVVIDYPQEKETISCPEYTIRVGPVNSSVVEVSIDGGEWNICRFAEGYWWFDWANYPAGKHKITARVRSDKGKTLKKSDIRSCETC